MSNPLVKISSKYSQSHTGRAREVKFEENVHPTLYVMSQVSPVTCHLSSVTCHVSRVTCHMSKYLFFQFLFNFKFFFSLKKLDKVVEQVGGGFVINGAYPV